MSAWVKCSERMPDTQDIKAYGACSLPMLCLNIYGPEYRVAICNRPEMYDAWWMDEESGCEVGVTHWQPLPAPPE